MMYKIKNSFLILFSFLLFTSCASDETVGKKDPDKEPPKKEQPIPLKIGYSVPLGSVKLEKMSYSKSVGIDYIEVSGLGGFFDTNRSFTKSDTEATNLMQVAKKATDDAGIEIWSIHMPFDEHMDLSTIDEENRKRVVNGHIKLLEYIKILKPKIILFHPSYYLDPPNQRDMRKSQFIKSAKELDEAVRKIGASMVVENMLGPDLMSGNRERPLLRTVDETVEIFNRLPNTINLAIDMNHIQNPEVLIRKMGKRLKSVHIADGTGKAENHWFPCSGQGNNNWIEILKALDEVGYKGPFMYECAYDDEKDLVNCYNSLYKQFVKTIK